MINTEIGAINGDTGEAAEKERPPRSEGLNRFSIGQFFTFYIILLIMSAVHTGLVLMAENYGMSAFVSVVLPMFYWAIVALVLAGFTRDQVTRIFEEPMRRLSKAAGQVAQGDFSVYVPSVHPPEQRDYVDDMIDDFNHMVEELGSVETMKTDFIANVSHELKTPISVIRSNAEIMRSDGISRERQTECADNIIRTADRLSGLITNILKLNKLDKQALMPQTQTYDLAAQLCECAAGFDRIIENKNIDFSAETEDHAYVTADAEFLELVWNNLLSNALKFTEAGGCVRITERSEGDLVIVEVSDTGCGMDENTMEHMYTRFYQGDGSHATEGNGLGLSLVKRVLELCDGEIEVESLPGEGSTFRVSIPVRRDGGA